jgi:hypothetical protein
VTLVRRLWLAHRTPDSLWARRITLAATVVFLLVVTRWRPWDLFDRGGFSTNFYDEQAHAFLRGRLDVPARVAGPEGFLIDGKTYLYYGPFLAIARLPFAVFGRWADFRLSAPSLVLAFFVVCTLTWHVARRVGDVLGGVSDRRATVLVAAVAVSPALSLAGWNSVYDETEMWAFALFLATALAALALWRRPSRQAAVLAVLLGTCTILTRTSIGIGALFAVGLVGLLLWQRNRSLAVSTGAGAFGGLVVSMLVNLAKFGTLLDLPADRQLLSLQDPERAAWFAGNGGSFFSTRFLPTTLVQYFRPDTVEFERLVPFVRFGPLATEHGSYPLEGNTPASSLTASATILFVVAMVGLWVIVRRRSWPLVALFAGAVVAAVPSFLIGFVANRYLTDMLPALVVPAAAALAVVPRPERISKRPAEVAVGLLTIWGLWVNVSLATWTQNLKEPGFTEMRYAIDDAVFGGTPPSVIDLVPGTAIPRDGIVAIDGECDGLYIAEQGNWVALELAEGVRRLRGTAESEVAVQAIGGSIHVLVDHVDDGTQIVVEYQPDAGDRMQGTPLVVDRSPVAIDIVSDPVTGRLEVRADGRLALFAFAAPGLSDAAVTGLSPVDTADRGTPICHDLQARR